MENINESFTKYTRSNLDAMLKKDYATAVKNPEFKKLVNTLKIKENVAYKYTSKLERTVCELNNCSNCKSLHTCQNKVEGTVYYPTIKDEKLEFNYVACKYKKKDIKQKEEIKSKFFEMPYHIKMAKMSNIEINSTRAKIIKWINKFYDDFKSGKQTKGLYLSGSFGSGKTYILSALLNELSKLNYSCIIVYYPELLRSIKESFNSDDYNERINEIKKCDLLLLDDIGAETTTPWNRDEILGTILQYRMDNKKATFFTSNLNIKELENHFITSNKDEEVIKARRIIERVKYLTDELELIGENKRK
ncbi:primosomal protein DnaI [bacterium]|nr:primosomal protein DnaI [bacterium]MDY3757470.1 primosomal protein DnaI [Bacilli bacterium]